MIVELQTAGPVLKPALGDPGISFTIGQHPEQLGHNVAIVRHADTDAPVVTDIIESRIVLASLTG